MSLSNNLRYCNNAFALHMALQPQLYGTNLISASQILHLGLSYLNRLLYTYQTHSILP